MKRTLTHLPDVKQQHVQSIAKFIRDSADVEMIILFGSFARGDWVEDPIGDYFSDYDVLVVVATAAMAANTSLWLSVGTRANNLLGKLSSATRGRTRVHLIVHDINDVNSQLEQGWYFFSDIKKEGVLLYDSERHVLAEARLRTISQRRAYAQGCFKEYFAIASDFFSYALSGIKNDRNRVAAFLLHQATETYYKCALLVLTTYRPKAHNIEELGNQCANLNRGFHNIFPMATQEEEDRFKLLKDAYVNARYSLNYRISRSDLEALAQCIAVLHERTEAICKEYIATLKPASAAR